MAMNFPSSPSVGQIYTSGEASFIWDGVKWKSLGVNVLTRDQNLADVPDKAAARSNLGLGGWRTITVLEPTVDTSLMIFGVPSDVKLIRLHGSINGTAQNSQLVLKSSKDGGATGESDYRNSYVWPTSTGTAGAGGGVETAVENTASFMYLAANNDIVVRAAVTAVVALGDANTIMTMTSDSAHFYQTFGQLRRFLTAGRGIGAGRRNAFHFYWTSGLIAAGSRVVVEGA